MWKVRVQLGFEPFFWQCISQKEVNPHLSKWGTSATGCIFLVRLNRDAVQYTRCIASVQRIVTNFSCRAYCSFLAMMVMASICDCSEPLVWVRPDGRRRHGVHGQTVEDSTSPEDVHG